MRYCKNCYFAFDPASERCPVCGSKDFREAEADDFCLLREARQAEADVLADTFERMGIACTLMPYGNGLRPYFALPSEYFRIYVPFAFLEEAKKVLRDRENAETESLRSVLSENSGKFHVGTPKAEKKIRKKCRLPQEIDLAAFCAQIAENSEKIIDGGPITTWEGGKYLFCFSGEWRLAVNSVTFEILSLTREKQK